MNTGFLLLYKFLKKEGILREFIHEYRVHNDFTTKQLSGYLGYINNVSATCERYEMNILLEMVSNGFSRVDFSFDWEYSNKGIVYWREKNSKFKNYLYTMIDEVLIPQVLKVDSFTFLISELRRYNLLSNFLNSFVLKNKNPNEPLWGPLWDEQIKDEIMIEFAKQMLSEKLKWTKISLAVDIMKYGLRDIMIVSDRNILSASDAIQKKISSILETLK